MRMPRRCLGHFKYILFYSLKSNLDLTYIYFLASQIETAEVGSQETVEVESTPSAPVAATPAAAAKSVTAPGPRHDGSAVLDKSTGSSSRLGASAKAAFRSLA